MLPMTGPLAGGNIHDARIETNSLDGVVGDSLRCDASATRAIREGWQRESKAMHERLRWGSSLHEPGLTQPSLAP